jgi:hypothetical protein
MSLPPVLVCSGAPRDLGLDQGLHFRAVIRAELGRRLGRRGIRRLLPPRLGGDPEAARAVRDTARFFPHMAERAEGIASGARVSRTEIGALLANEQRGVSQTLVGVRAGPAGSGVWIALTVERELALFLRRSQPDNGYRSLEVALPWRVPALAGVNEHGLAVVASGLGSSSAPLSNCAAAAALLVQDCLQRFDSAEKAVEWCERRPAGGSASILLADAGGALVRVDLQGELRRVHRETGGEPLGAGEPTRVASVEKACRARRRLDAEALRGILSAHGERALVLNPADPERILG